jgi:DNA-binding YbaB/EbfC family protein
MFKGLTGGLGALGDMSQMLANAQKMQMRMADMQSELDRIEVEAEAGAGMVRAVCSAKGALRRIEIDDTLMSVDEKATAQDLIVAAVAAAQVKAQAKAQEEMQALASEMGLPPGMLPG